MNKKYFFHLTPLLFVCQLICSFSPDLDPVYTFTIEFPVNCSSSLPIAARCKGERLSIKNGSCTLPKGAVQDIFYIIVLERIEPYKNKRSIVKLKKKSGIPCKYYSVVRNSTAAFNKEQEPWIIAEIPLEEQAEILPENALLVFMNPAYVEGLRIVRSKGNQTKPVPSLVLKAQVSQEMLGESVDTCALALLDTNMLHKSPTIFKEWTGTRLRERRV